MKYFKNHPSVLTIKEFLKFGNPIFLLSPHPPKSIKFNDISVKVLKKCKDLISPFSRYVCTHW